MSSYPQPTEITPIFVPQYWIPSEETGSGISQAEADARYLLIAGNQTVLGEEAFQNGIKTNDIAPNTGSDVDIDGNVNLSSGNTYQINGVDLIASQTGQSGKYLTTNGTSTSWTTLTPAGSDTQVQFNDGGSAFGGDSGLTYNKTTDVLTTTGGYNTTSGTYNVNGTALVASQSGNSGKYLTTNGTSTSWATLTPGGSTTQIQFNDGGVLSGDSGLYYDKTNDILYTVGGAYLGYANVGRYVQIRADTTDNAYVDFHSNDSNVSAVDYDTRIISTGGTDGVVGEGSLSYNALSHTFNNTVNVSTNNLSYFPGATTFSVSLTMNTTNYRSGHFLEFAGSSGQTLTFPNPTTCPGYEFTLLNNTVHTLNIATPAGQILAIFPVGTIITLTTMNSVRSFIIKSNGSNWWIIGGRY